MVFLHHSIYASADKNAISAFDDKKVLSASEDEIASARYTPSAM